MNVLVGALQSRGDVPELPVRLGHHFLEFCNRLGGPNAGHDILALGVDEELAVELLRTRRRVACETHAGRGAVAAVAEDHHLHVDGGADVIRNLIDAAVLLRPRIHPRAKHRVPRHRQLLARILRKVMPRTGAHDLLVAQDHLAQRFFIEAGVERHPFRLLDRHEFVLEDVLGDFEHDAAEHLHESAVAVEREPSVRSPCLQPLDGRIVEAEIEDGVHHSRHGKFRTGANRHQERVRRRAKRRAGNFLQLLEVGRNLRVDGRGDLAFLLVVHRTDVGGDRETWGHGESGVGHLRKAGALATEHGAHAAIAIGLPVAEEIHILRAARGARRRLGYR